MARPANTIQKIISRMVRTPSGCWILPIKPGKDGYVRTSIKKQRFFIHRLMYEHFIGPVPDGRDLHHVCENRSCGEPAHLTPLKRREHTKLGQTIIAKNVRKTHCVRGHPFAGKNLKFNPRGERVCYACKLIVAAECRERQRQKPHATHCPKGHEYTPGNTWVKADGRWVCKTCLTSGWKNGAAYPQRKNRKSIPHSAQDP